jgi:hypothetical protein
VPSSRRETTKPSAGQLTERRVSSLQSDGRTEPDGPRRGAAVPALKGNHTYMITCLVCLSIPPLPPPSLLNAIRRVASQAAQRSLDRSMASLCSTRHPEHALHTLVVSACGTCMLASCCLFVVRIVAPTRTRQRNSVLETNSLGERCTGAACAVTTTRTEQVSNRRSDVAGRV